MEKAGTAQRHKKSGDTREEEGATANHRRPREEEGPSDLCIPLLAVGGLIGAGPQHRPV